MQQWWTIRDPEARTAAKANHAKQWRLVQVLDCGAEYANDRGDHYYINGSNKNRFYWNNEPSRRIAWLLVHTAMAGLPPGVTVEMPKDGFSFIALRRGTRLETVLIPKGWALRGALDTLFKPKTKEPQPPLTEPNPEAPQ